MPGQEGAVQKVLDRNEAMILGVVLAGGQSTRFGSDKALAELGGHTLLARAFDALTGLCELVVIAGRDTGPGHCIPDWPRAGHGPARRDRRRAAPRPRRGLRQRADLRRGFGRPARQPARAARPPPRPIVESQPVIGHWPAGAVDAIETLLLADGKHSMLAFAEAIGATAGENRRQTC